MLTKAIENLVRGQVQSRSFVLHWAQDKPKDIIWMNRMLTLPGVNQIGDYPAHYDDGEPIPGTLVLSDFIGEDEEGNTKLFFDALKAVHHFLGILPRRAPNGQIVNDDPKGALFNAGLSVLPPVPTRDDVKITLSLAKDRLVEFEYTRALSTVSEFDSRNENRRKASMEGIPGGAAYNEAVLIIRRHENRQAKALGVTVEDLKGREIDEDDLDFKIFMKSKLIDRVEELLDTTAEKRSMVLRDLLEDPQVRRKLWNEYSIRKKGHAPETLASLEEAAQQVVEEEASTAPSA